MDIQQLVKMANNIGSFFESDADRARGARSIAEHIKSFWDPRMRREMLLHLDKKNGDGLNALVLEALKTHRSLLG